MAKEKEELELSPEDVIDYVRDFLGDFQSKLGELIKKLEGYSEPDEEEKPPSSMNLEEYTRWRRRGGGK